MSHKPPVREHIHSYISSRSVTYQVFVNINVQVVEFGYAFFANRQLITVFSASRYHEDLCNFAAVVLVSGRLFPICLLMLS